MDLSVSVMDIIVLIILLNRFLYCLPMLWIIPHHFPHMIRIFAVIYWIIVDKALLIETDWWLLTVMLFEINYSCVLKVMVAKL